MKEAIISAHGGGGLLAWLANAVTDTAGPEGEAIFALTAQLHRAGEIDALSALLDPKAAWDWTPEWLARQQILRAVVPRLAASVERMMAAIGAIETPIAQYVLDDAFLSWCAADLGRAGEVIALIDEGAHVADRFVLAALVAGLRASPKDYLATSASTARGERPGGRHVGVRALGLMPLTDDASVACAVHALRSVIEDRDLDRRVRADALSAAIDIAARAPAAPAGQFLELLRLAPGDADPGLLETCAEAFGRHAPRLPVPLLECMREILPKLDRERMQAFDRVDMGLYQLLSGPGGDDQAAAIIEVLVHREDGDAVFERLDSTRHELSNGNDPRLSRVLVRWLLSGEATLCNAAATLVRGVHGRELSLGVDFQELALTDAQASFLARKAIGWFLLQPAAATSLVVSLLRQVTDTGAEPLGDLLFDPLLMNYPGSVRRHLERAAPNMSGAARETVDKTLAKHDAYLRAIEAVGRVPELHQSERNRRIEFQRRNDEFSAARRDAEKQSVLLSLVHKTLLLHGVRTIGYADDFGGGTRRLDNKLGRVSAEMELAMQWTFDPLGLEHTLRAFRLERTSE